MSNKKEQQALDTATFQRIQRWYLLALAGIAVTIIIAQILIQTHLNSQLNDSRVINVAGRQRALSQKLVKEALLLKEWNVSEKRHQVLLDIKETLRVWVASHKGLQLGNSEMNLPTEKDAEMLSLFQTIDKHHKVMVKATEAILSKEHITTPQIAKELNVLLANEEPFLRLMDEMVNRYDQHSKAKLENLKRKEYVLLAFSLLILLLEFLFIFKPLSIQIRKTISSLIKSHSQSEAAAKKIETLLFEKEKSLKELQELNFLIDNAALFASVKKDGTIVFISKKFRHLLGVDKKQLNKPLSELLSIDEGQQSYLKEVFKSNKKNSIRTEEIELTTHKAEHIWLDISIIPIRQASSQQGILILCSDITERKINQLKVAQLTQQNFEERMHQKKVQASQIVEGQEEERKRIAKDIHDGIGQMLTALRFNIESIDVSNKEKTKEKIAYLKNLTADLIKGVRTATFNLTPPELSDHGIFPALHKMTVELSKLTGNTILFDNKIEANIRFNSLVETNMYRVTQEAVNNAIKYAQAQYILVSINFSNNILSIVIDDDGKGFDTAILGKIPKNNSEGGMGLFFMKERMSYINGRLFINSVLGKGTRVTINYKINNTEEFDGTE